MKKFFIFATVCITVFGLSAFALATPTDMWSGHHFFGFESNIVINDKQYTSFDTGEWLSGNRQTSGFVTLPGNGGTNSYNGASAESYFSNAGISASTVTTLKTIVAAYEGIKAGYENSNPLYPYNDYAFNSTYGSLAQLLIWELLYDNVMPTSVDAFKDGNFKLESDLPLNMYKAGFQETLDSFLVAMESANPNTVIFSMHYTVANPGQDSPAILSYGHGSAPAPTPVPAAVWLMGTGLAGIGVMRRKAF